MRKGWQTKPLGDLCEFQRGLTYAKGDEVDISENIVLRATNIDLKTNLLDFAELKYISDRIAVPDSKKVKKDSLMICTASGSKSHLGKVAYIDDEYGYAFGGFMGMITPKKALLPKYLFHLMTSDAYKDFIGELSDGTNINNLKFDDLKRFQVPHPSLPEQQRIVGILDVSFEGVATARANAEKNLQNARALFESYLQSVFTQRGEGWVEKRLAEVAESISTGPFGSMLHKSDYVQDGIPLVNPMNIVDSKIVPSSKMMVNKETRDRLSSYVLRVGDVVIGRRGELGRCAVVTQREAGWLCGTGSFFVRLSDAMDGEFFVALFGSEQFKARLEATAVGATMSSLNHGILNDLLLPAPPIPMQRKIMNKAHELRAETQHLASLYQRKLAALEALKKSLLHQAFNGQLTKDNGQ
jgi:type I restriction enzyme S subunit